MDIVKHLKEIVDVLNKINRSIKEKIEKCGIFASLDSPANTTVITASTYYPIQGAFTNYPIENFGAATVDTPGIKYTGTEMRFFKIDWFVTGSANIAGTTVSFGIKKNGVIVSNSIMAQLCKTAGYKYALSGTIVVELAQNDEIQLVLTSDGDGDVITAEYYTTTIAKFLD